MDRPLVSAGLFCGPGPQKRAGGPLLHHHTQTTQAIAMKPAGNVAAHASDIAAKFHRNRRGSFCVAAVRRCNFVKIGDWQKSTVHRAPLKNYRSHLSETWQQCRNHVGLHCWQVSSQSLRQFLCGGAIMDRPLVSAGLFCGPGPQKRAGGPLLHRQTKTAEAIAMKLASNVAPHTPDIAAKFHRNRRGSFCVAAVRRCNFVEIGDWQKSTVHRAPLKNYRSHLNETWQQCRNHVGLHCWQVSSQSLRQFLCGGAIMDRPLVSAGLFCGSFLRTGPAETSGRSIIAPPNKNCRSDCDETCQQCSPAYARHCCRVSLQSLRQFLCGGCATVQFWDACVTECQKTTVHRAPLKNYQSHCNETWRRCSAHWSHHCHQVSSESIE